MMRTHSRGIVDWPSTTTTKTRGEVEADVRKGMIRFQREYLGRGPGDVHVYLIGDLILVRLQDALTASERQLLKLLPNEKGRDLVKQSRTELVETTRPVLEAMVEEASGAQVVSLHRDISTITGEIIVVFVLAQPPVLRDSTDRGG